MHANCTSDFSGLEIGERLDAVGCRRESSEADRDSATHTQMYFTGAGKSS